MFRFISWLSFLSFLIILSAVYYTGILLIYYRKELTQLISRIGGVFLNQQNDQLSAVLAKNDSDTDPLKNIGILALQQDLNGLFHTAAQTKPEKEELYTALQMLLQGYRDLKNESQTKQINHQINVLCKNTCSITLSEAELNMLWNG